MESNKPRRDRLSNLPRREVLEQQTKELMLAVLIRSPEAFTAVRETLKPESFPDYERGYAVLWRLVCDYFAAEGELPVKEWLRASIEDGDKSNPDFLNDVEYEKLLDLLDYAFTESNFDGKQINTDSKCASWAIKICRRFLEECLSNKVKETLRSQKLIPVDLSAVLSDYAVQTEQLATLSVSDQDMLAYADGWDSNVKINVCSTGISFLDSFLGGGHVNGEIYGFLGPFGSCKTTLAAMLVAEAARSFNLETRRENFSGTPALAFVFSYEEPKKGMQARTLGYYAKIRRETLEKMESRASFSTSDSLLEYEKILFNDDSINGRPVLGEFDRSEIVLPILNRHVVFVDMTGESLAGAGNGGIKEAAQIISSVCRRRKARCGLAVFDYLGAMIKKYAAAIDADERREMQLLKSANLQLKNQISIAYSCPTWILQQFTGEANSYNSTTVADHTKSAGDRSFAENLDFSFSVSKPEDLTGLALIACTKHRRQPGRLSTIIRVEGGMYRVVDDNDMVAVVGRRFVPVSELAGMPGSGQGATITPVMSVTDLDIDEPVNDLNDNDEEGGSSANA